MLSRTLFLSTLLFTFFNLPTRALAEVKVSVKSPKTIINIYTYSSFVNPKYGAGIKLKTLFEQQYPSCNISYTAIQGANAMFNRLRLDGKQTSADMVIGLNNFMLAEAKQSGLFGVSSFTTTDENNQSLERKLNLASLPKELRDPVFIPFGFATYAFVYDKTKLKNPPKSLEELIKRPSLRIIYPDPRTSALGQGMMALINQAYPAEEVSQIWQKLNQHTVTITKGWSEAYGAFLEGEADLVLSYNTSPFYHQLEEKNFNYIATNFTPHIAQVEFFATIEGRQNQCTFSFSKFMLSPEAQKILARSNVMLPVTNNTNIPVYTRLYHQTMQNKQTKPSFIYPSAEEMQNWVNTWQQALSQ